jgi:hypothetical protein
MAVNLNYKLATKETVVIQRRKSETLLPSKQEHIPDTDLLRAITKDELLKGIKSDIRAMYAKREQ